MPLCVNGPLAGETHERGPSFEFDGRLIGEESGTYRLVDGMYCWEADPPSKAAEHPCQH